MMITLESVGIVWHTSSYSTTHGDCVQVGWSKSSYSSGASACVEVAPAPDRVLVRDSKNPDGPVLDLPTPAWRAFLSTVTH
jgi:uncharacterized protein DUF397